MASSYSTINAIRPFNLNTPSHENASISSFKTSLPFLGSTQELRPNLLTCKSPSASSSRRQSSIVAVSDVVKEKKVKSSSSSPNLVIH